MTTSPEPWRLGAELVRLCLLAAGLALLVYSAPALSDRGGVREPRSVSIDAAGTATWRVTALGIDPASFLYLRTDLLRAPPQ